MTRRRYDMDRPDIRLAVNLGWHYVGQTRGGRWRFKNPATGTIVNLARNWPNARGIQNIIAEIRRLTP